MFGESTQEEIPQKMRRTKTPRKEEYFGEDELCLSSLFLLLLNILTIQLSPPGNTHGVLYLMLTSICHSITQ